MHEKLTPSRELLLRALGILYEAGLTETTWTAIGERQQIIGALGALRQSGEFPITHSPGNFVSSDPQGGVDYLHVRPCNRARPDWGWVATAPGAPFRLFRHTPEPGGLFNGIYAVQDVTDGREELPLLFNVDGTPVLPHLTNSLTKSLVACGREVSQGVPADGNAYVAAALWRTVSRTPNSASIEAPQLEI